MYIFGNFGAVQSCDPMNCKVVVVLEYLSGAKRSHGRLKQLFNGPDEQKPFEEMKRVRRRRHADVDLDHNLVIFLNHYLGCSVSPMAEIKNILNPQKVDRHLLKFQFSIFINYELCTLLDDTSYRTSSLHDESHQLISYLTVCPAKVKRGKYKTKTKLTTTMSSLALVLAADQEADCQNRILVDVAPVVGSGTSSSSTVETVTVDGRNAFLARQTSLGEQADTFNAAAAAALYSQYAVIQQQYTAALAAVARAAAAAAAAASRSNSTGSGCLAPSMPYPYLIATGQQFVSNLSFQRSAQPPRLLLLPLVIAS
ncbi:Topoisomerase 1-associated factor [Trichinella spiralis]|uniref:Topoisomerase 1-associated factor n=1 Tax=Trichinella spiralis TaxID=6334 RepID=A0ABR3K6N0_TRISP